MAVSGDISGAQESNDGLEATELERVPSDRDGSVTVDEALQDADGRTEMVVRFGSADLPSALSEAEAVDALQAHADESQAEALRWAETTDGVEVENTFWIFNGILLEVDVDEVSAKEVAHATGAESVHANFELTTADGNADGASGAASASAPVESNDTETTYGLDMINATEVWDQHGTQGEGATVAVLDSGIDADHPDLDLYTEDPNDPTYPGGYMSFDEDGNQLPDAEPEDTSGHGTHTSGTVAGSDDPAGVDEAFGVAPGVDLLHGQVIPGGGGSFTQVVAGMEWAVDDTDADVISMSLGGEGYSSEMIEPSENARDAGVVLVASAGNNNHGTSDAPGNVYPNFASGAVDANHDVADFSSGETITTASAYPDAPDYWPDEYIVPNAAAPGVDVLSSVPGGGYDDTYSGTSMSAPHKAGAFALMISASGGDADREMLYDAMESTAWKPDDWDEPGDEYDERYGKGIIDAKAATDMVALDSGVEGTVTDVDGEPIEGATVTNVDSGFETTTDADGEYTLLAQPGTYEIEVTAFGFDSETATVEVPDNETFVEQDFDLEFGLGVELAGDQPESIEGGDSFDVTFDVANLETYAVERAGDYDGDLEFTFEGEPVDEGEAIDVGDLTGEVTLTVTTEADTAGELELEHAFAGSGDTETITTGPTAVFETLVPIAVVDDGSYGDDVVDRLEDRLMANYDISLISGDEAVDAAENGEYTAYVVQDIDETYVEDLATYTDDPSTGVVWLDGWGNDSNAIPARSNVLGNPESTDDDFSSPNPDVELLANHPIFDGVGDAGDSVPIHDASWADHSWFDGYDGDVIGHIQAGGVTDGGGIGVDEEQRTALLSTFGSSSYVGSGEFSAEADTILANAVEWAAEAPPATLVTEQPAHVDSGEMFGAAFDVEELEKIQVSLANESTADRDELDLYVGGTVNAWDEWRAYDPPMTADDYAVEVDPADETVGSVALETTFVFEDEEVTMTTGPTAIYEKPLTVGDDVDTIQEAVDLAPDGAEIVVENGTYEEIVSVTDTDDLTITGEGDATIVAPDDADTSEAVHIGADGTSVSGVTAEGIAVEDAANVSVTDVAVTNATTGVAVTDGTDVTVTASEATAVDHGIAVNASENVTVTENAVTAAVTGVSVSDSAVATVSMNDVSGTETGIAVADGATAALSDNEITDSTVGLSVADAGTAVEATMNTIAAETGVAVSDIATDAVSVAYNDLEASETVLAQSGDDPFDGRLNWFGERGPAAADVEGDVVSQPFLTDAPDAVDHEETTAIAVDLEFDAGETYTVGVPGTTDQTVGDVFGDLNGTVYDYDAENGAWTTLNDTDELSSLSAVMVVPDEDGRAVMEFQSDEDTVIPGSESLTQGWNLVSPTAYAEYDDGFGSSNTPDSVLTAYDHADGHLGEDVDHLGDEYAVDGDANPFGGYWIHVESADDTYEYGVDLHTNPTVEEIYEALGLMTETDSAASIDATAPSAQASG